MDVAKFNACVMPKIITEPACGCWIWNGSLDKDGYGKVKVNGKTLRPHRVAYETFIGMVPDGLVLDHLCRLRCCANPWHLEPVTNLQNIRRGTRSPLLGKYRLKNTHCPHGHPYSGGNLRIAQNGQRVCKTCQRETMRKRRCHLPRKGHFTKITAEVRAKIEAMIGCGYSIQDIITASGISRSCLHRNFKIRQMRRRKPKA